MIIMEAIQILHFGGKNGQKYMKMKVDTSAFTWNIKHTDKAGGEYWSVRIIVIKPGEILQSRDRSLWSILNEFPNTISF